MQEPEIAGRYPDRDPQLFYELTKERLSAQLDVIDGVDNKLGLLFSVSSGLMGILVAVFAVKASAVFAPGAKGPGLTAGDYLVVAIAGAWYVIAVGATLIGYYGRKWGIGPSLDAVWGDLHNRKLDDQRLKWQVANSNWAFYRNNEKAQRLKSTCTRFALWSVIFQTAAICSALGLVAAGG